MAVGLALVALLSACQKEPLGNRLELVAEGMGGRGEKMTVNGNVANWQTGDKVNINGAEYEVTVGGSPKRAYISSVPVSSSYVGVSPASIYSSRTGDVLTVTMPHSYQYRTEGSYPNHQVLDAPMAAYLEGDGRMMFKHLTGALTVNVTTNIGDPFVIDRIVVKSTENYKLSGTMTVNASDIDNSVVAINNGSFSSECYEVEMLFDFEQPSSTSSFSVQIPVPAAGIYNDNMQKEHFNVTVVGHYFGKRYTFTQTQTSGGWLQRAEMGQVSVNMTTSTTTESALFDTDGAGRYMIHTPTEFMLMTTAVSSNDYYDNYGSRFYRDGSYRIMTDIDMTGYEPSCMSAYGSSFILDGGNHTVHNLRMVENGNRGGEFGLLVNGPSGTVKNITIDGFTLVRIVCTSNNSCTVGAIASSGNPTIDNVTITGFKWDPGSTAGSTKPGGILFGGFVGSASDGTSISNSSLSFVDNMSVYTSYETTGYSPGTESRFGGIVGQTAFMGTVTLENVNVNVGYFQLFTSKNVSNPTVVTQLVMAGGVSARSLGTVTASGCTVSGTIFARPLSPHTGLVGKVFGESQTNEYEGVTVNGLNIYSSNYTN